MPSAARGNRAELRSTAPRGSDRSTTSTIRWSRKGGACGSRYPCQREDSRRTAQSVSSLLRASGSARPWTKLIASTRGCISRIRSWLAISQGSELAALSAFGHTRVLSDVTEAEAYDARGPKLVF